MILRISGRRWFARLRNEGRHVRSGVLSCTMILDPSLAGPHVGYALGRSFGTAVERNRLRRQLRALLHKQAGALPAGVFVFGASPRARGMSADELRGSLQGLFRRIGQGVS